MQDSLQTQRWRDFRHRAEYAPENVYRHQLCGWEYIPVHPFGDEPEVLDRLGLRPVDCWGVDAWWGVEEDATLLQSCVVGVARCTAGLYAHRTTHEEGWMYLTAIFDAPFVTRTAFEAAMSQFVALGFPTGEQFLLLPRQGLVRLQTGGCG